jgi:hypothetical protein
MPATTPCVPNPVAQRDELQEMGWTRLHDLPKWEIFEMVEEYHKKHGECPDEPQCRPRLSCQAT